VASTLTATNFGSTATWVAQLSVMRLRWVAPRVPSTYSPLGMAHNTRRRSRSYASGSAPSGTGPTRRDSPPIPVRLARPVVTAPLGVELAEEQRAALCFGLLADCGRRGAQGLQSPQEAAVGVVLPPHVARPAPSGGSQGVQTAVISDTGVGVGLD